MSDSSSEQRSRPRIGIDVACRVTRDHAQWHGRCVDATLDGVRLQVAAPFVVGDELRVALAGTREEFLVCGVVVHADGEDFGVALHANPESSRALFQLLLDQARAQNDECERLVDHVIARGRGAAKPPPKPARLMSLGDPLDSDSDLSGA